MSDLKHTKTLNYFEGALIERIRSGSNTYYFLLVVFALMMLAGSIAGLQATVGGHHVYYGVTREISWGVLISVYIYFVVTSTGLCLVSSAGHIFGVEAFNPIAKRAVFMSIATLLAGFFVISAEIKVPIRMMLYNIISPNLTSNIWWMGTLYGVALAVMLLEFIFLYLKRHNPAIICGFIAVIAEIAANSNLAAVFGLLNGREFWHGPLLPVFFIASAIMVGGSAIIFFNYLAHKINGEQVDFPMARALNASRKVAILGICIVLFFTIWRMVSGLAGEPNGLYKGTMAMVAGNYAISFWFFEIFLGMLLPLALFIMAGKENRAMMFVAASLMFIGVFFMRYNMVIVGQTIDVYSSIGVTGTQSLLEYFPSFNEMIVTLGGFGLTGFLFMLGEKVFAGHKVTDDHH